MNQYNIEDFNDKNINIFLIISNVFYIKKKTKHIKLDIKMRMTVKVNIIAR